MIRPATLADVPAILPMCRKFYESTHYTAFAPLCMDSLEAVVRGLIAEGVFLVADEGELVGMVGLAKVPFLFNQSRLAALEVCWWVNPEAQGHGVGKALLEAVEPACAGCDYIQMIHLANSPPQAAALYERLGYRFSESSYIKESANGR